MPHGSTEEHFFGRLEEAMTAIRLFQPDALVLPLGFDIYHNDIQAKVAVTTEGFCRLGNRISRAGLPMLVVQEGGYDLEALSNNVQQYFKGLNA
jgi:acetoin utilization deacetylase AcuC-like enzyme